MRTFFASYKFIVEFPLENEKQKKKGERRGILPFRNELKIKQNWKLNEWKTNDANAHKEIGN